MTTRPTPERLAEIRATDPSYVASVLQATAAVALSEARAWRDLWAEIDALRAEAKPPRAEETVQILPLAHHFATLRDVILLYPESDLRALALRHLDASKGALWRIGNPASPDALPLTPQEFHEAAIGYAEQAFDRWHDEHKACAGAESRAIFRAHARERLAQLATIYAGALDERSSK